MDELMEGIAAKHVERSLSEIRDNAKRGRWLDGTRAKEQAAEIVADVLSKLGVTNEESR